MSDSVSNAKLGDLSKDVRTLLAQRERALVNLGNAEVEIARQRAALAEIRAKLFESDDAVELSIGSVDFW